MKKLFVFLMIAFSSHLFAEENRNDVLLYEFDTYTHKASIAGAEYLNPSTIFWDDSVLYRGVAYEVTGIKDFAFYKNSTLRSFWFMMNKGYIGKAAFAGCSNLKDFALFGGEKLTIYTYAFQRCYNLSKITIATDRLILIPDKESPYYPLRNTFQGCTGIDTVQWRVKEFETLHNMHESLFAASKDHISYFEFSEDVRCIPKFICQDFSALEKVDIADKINEIGESAFQNCIRLTSVIIPGSVKVIGESAFEGCASLENLVIGNGVRKIGSNAFQYCRSIKSVIIPSTVTKIEYEAFSGCTNLQTIHIQSPHTMIEIASSAIPSNTKVIFSDGVTMIGGVVQTKYNTTKQKPKQNLDKKVPQTNPKQGLTK